MSVVCDTMGGVYRQVMVLTGILNFLMPMSVAINPNCDYYQDMAMGQDYFIHNQEYPNYYGPSISCRWVGISPPGTNIAISCEDIYIQASVNCQSDHVSISLTGDPNFQDATNYCGVTQTTLITQSNSIAIGLFTAYNSPGGRFICTLTAIQIDPTPSPPPNPTSCDCGWRHQTRIIGGQNAGVNEYPSMSVLVDKLTDDGFCGASIISERYAVTAAHCLLQYVPSDLWLLVGDHDLSTTSETAASSWYNLEEFQPHPNYNSTNQQDDIAVIKTTAAIQFSMLVGPVCLPFRYSTVDFYAQTVTALGWGFLDFSGNKSDILQQVDLGIVSNTECAEKIPDPITYRQICTYAPEKDSCLSDSGGPLLWVDPSTQKMNLVGIISYGLACATSAPSVNTRVSSYLAWIVSMTPDAFYCIK